MLPYNGFLQHQQSYVESASPEGLIALLYGEVLRAIIGAKEAILRGDRVRKRRCIAKAVEILAELVASINMEKGGALGEQMALLYEYVLKRLLQSNLSDAPEPLNEAAELLATIKGAWDQICLPSSSVDAVKAGAVSLKEGV